MNHWSSLAHPEAHRFRDLGFFPASSRASCCYTGRMPLYWCSKDHIMANLAHDGNPLVVDVHDPVRVYLAPILGFSYLNQNP